MPIPFPAGHTAEQLYVTGARQGALVVPHAKVPTGYEAYYDRALICRVDVPRRSAASIVEYQTPPHLSADDRPGILFKTAHIEGDTLYVPTQTEILIYHLPDCHMLANVSIPMFNDVHHVRPSPRGGLVVTNTGLDMVVELGPDGSVWQEWSAVDESPWVRFSRDIDYRKVKTTKPHRAHPNFTFFLEDELWVTRFEQRDAISLTNPGRVIRMPGERIHDGVVHGNRIYFTHVDGKVSVVGRESLAVEAEIDLSEFYPADTLLGWTRGLAVDGSGLWVGFSRIRHTRFRENLSWMRRGFRASLPTRIAYFDLSTSTLGPTINLEPAGMNSVFGVLLRTAPHGPLHP